jgi:sec-independent protein translocase protein TatC
MSTNQNKEQEKTLIFLNELRSRIIYCLLLLFSLFVCLFYFANHLYTWLALPLLKFLPARHLIATQIVSPFFVPFKLAFMAAIWLAMPFFLYQLWTFIAPALYRHERKVIWPFLIASALLFYAGMAFAYFIIFPALFRFLAGVVPDGVLLSPDISEYLDFTMRLLLTFGALFEIPIAMVFVVFLGLMGRADFIRLRGYALLSAFIIAMFLAPPDVLSQSLLALPIYLLYEAGILLSRFLP